MQFQTSVFNLTTDQIFEELKYLDPNIRHADAIHQFNRLLEQLRSNDLPLSQFLADFGDSLFEAVTDQNRPLYQGQTHAAHEAVLDGLSRKLFPAQREVVRAVNQLLLVEDKPAAVINAEMGTGKTMMAIACAAVAHQAGIARTLVLSPPHLVYKWRREILKTVPDARVWVLNGTDTLAKLLKIRAMRGKPAVPEFFVLGRVRMRMGYHWRPAYAVRKQYRQDYAEGQHFIRTEKLFCCPKCGRELKDEEGSSFYSEEGVKTFLGKSRRFCTAKDGKHRCGEPLWTLCRKDGNAPQQSVYERVINAVASLPGVGPKTAQKLVAQFGEAMLADILENNIQAFANLMDEHGEFVFNDRQAARLDRALGKTEFSLGMGGYQPTEFIKRYLPKGYFGLMVVDEGHEYKNYGTAQGQAMGVLARCVRKVLCLTGTLMGGYADDLFYLLWRLNPQAMLADGFGYNKTNTLGTAAMAFMRQHGVLKEVIRSNGSEFDGGSFTSSKAKRTSVRTAKTPGFGPLGIMRYILPMTVFLKLRDLGEGVLPPYEEIFRPVAMTPRQESIYRDMSLRLQQRLKQALAKGDNTLTGVVTNTLLAWPDCGHQPERVVWKRWNERLFEAEAVFEESEPSPKEADLLAVVKEELAQGRKCLVYTVYTDTRDTAGRLQKLLQAEGIKAAVMRASVKADEREDWVATRLDEGCEVVICNPELVKTGLDLLAFPTIYFMQTGYNVYTLMQAARRSWRIGQKEHVKVYFAGYMETAQQICLELMAKKIAVAQSTSGDMPDTGLDILNQAEDSVEVQLAKRLLEQ
ncbi:SNF2-related protein [Neisseria weixii]|uniref:SNF2-related protein n=1 Tax=Neisseria weixii TaxID=1853276 RepID=UPI000BB72853|nr:SNF2-related protein [Neisseria weixii]ATD64956.1 helicase [Neisseria weixii]